MGCYIFFWSYLEQGYIYHLRKLVHLFKLFGFPIGIIVDFEKVKLSK